MILKSPYYHTCQDGCGCGSKSNLNTFEQHLVGKQGNAGPQGQPGPSGKNNVLNGSVTNGTTDSNGTDEAIGGSTISALQAAGFDPTTKPTLKASTDPSDTANTKYWIRESNSFLNWLASFVLPLLLPKPATDNSDSGKIPVISGSTWDLSTPTNEIYNATSTTSFGITPLLIGSTLLFATPLGLAYRAGQQVWIIDYTSDTLNTSNYISGVVEGYTGAVLYVKCTFISGSGTPLKWHIGLGSAAQLPYYDATIGNGMSLVNNAGVLGWGFNGIFTGFKTEWWNNTPPAGWLLCNGAVYDQASYPALYQILRPGGAATRYGYTTTGTPLSSTQFRVPGGEGYAFAMVDVSNPDFDAPGKRIGVASEAITAKYLPQTSPWALVDPGHSHTMAPTGTFNAGGGGTGVPFNGSGTTNSANTGITLSNNSDPDFGTPFSKYQPTEACYFIIKT